MIKRAILFLFLVSLLIGLTGCGDSNKKVKIGVSLGVGPASRWESEKKHMEERAQEIGADIEVRLNKTDKPKTQKEDCLEMIDKGINVLLITPRDVNNVGDIVAYAKSKNVKVISYARVVLGEKVDLFVGYDSNRIGQGLGQHLTEMVYKGNYILLSGDPNDHNADLLYNGAMRYIEPIKNDINIILDTPVPDWSPVKAKALVITALQANGNKVDAILAPNDKIAGACAEALAELNITNHVVITGMDCELEALQRIVTDKQDVTNYMDLREVATAAIDEAYNLATNKPVDVNAKFDNNTPTGIDAKLIAGKLITKANIDKVIIDGGIFSKEEVYGTK